jgi:hypothetical protein
MRVPSSSSSRSESFSLIAAAAYDQLRTDGDRLNLDAILEMRVRWVISILALEDFLAAQCVDKGGSA